MNRSKGGRFSDQPDPFDFSPAPQSTRQLTRATQKRGAERLAAKSNRKRLVAFFDALDRAHNLWGSGDKGDRDAVQIALKAVGALVQVSRENENQRYSYLFDLLAEKLKPHQIVAQLRRPGERDSRSTNIKAATAYLVEYLATRGGQGRAVRKLCRYAAELLTERGFPFSGKKASAKATHSADTLLADRAKTIEHWRRDFSRAGFGGPAGELFRAYRRKQPFQAAGLGASRVNAALQWWFDELRKNRY
jgi:hypothetical protein